VKLNPLKEILPILKGRIMTGNEESYFNKVVTKIKHVKPNSLLFCIDKKEAEALKKANLPPCIVVIDHLELVNHLDQEGVTVVTVKRTKAAFRKFLTYYRSIFDIPVISITGSTGKTTTKEMITHILKKQGNVKSTILNYNLFRSNAAVLLRFDEKTDFAVFELGVGYRGHLSLCSKYFGPFSTVITTIGADHISRFESKEDYIQEKAKIFKGLGEKNVVVLNADCENTKKVNLSTVTNKIFTYGFSDDADYKASNFHYVENGVSFTLTYENQLYDVFVPGYGKHNVYNALAAITTTNAHGVPIEVSIERLKSYKHPRRHLEVSTGLNGATIIDDTWNTNSTSVKAALTVLKDISKEKKTVAILGQISELGTEEENEHRLIGREVFAKQIDKLITVGETASMIANEAIKMGMKKEDIFPCVNESEVLSAVAELADPNSMILVKTSMRQSFRDFMKKLKQ
jgi:UDP-N-acetylmuramoyl-tripeptide--D-alanyl-D-alanine ligase